MRNFIERHPVDLDEVLKFQTLVLVAIGVDTSEYAILVGFIYLPCYPYFFFNERGGTMLPREY